MYRRFSLLIFGIVLIYTIESAGAQVFLTGKVTHNGPNAIPRNAKCEVSLQDVSRMDAASIVIASVVLQATAFPVSYQLKYNPALIKPGFTYTINARITGADGQLIFSNDAHLGVDFSHLRTTYFEIPVTRINTDVGTGAGKGLGVGGEKFITGTITSVGSNKVRENLQVTVELRDISLMDVASKLIGSTVFSATSFPIQYKLKYNPSEIQSSGRYSLSVEIKGSNGIILYTNEFGTSVDFSISTSPKVDISVTRTGRNINSNSVCDLPKAPGRCFGLFRRFFHNSLTGNCESFVYGGCGGNKNNFKSKNQCQLTCKA